jgi:hypothetical protein
MINSFVKIKPDGGAGDVVFNHYRPNMALGGFTPKQRLAMAA